MTYDNRYQSCTGENKYKKSANSKKWLNSGATEHYIMYTLREYTLYILENWFKILCLLSASKLSHRLNDYVATKITKRPKIIIMVYRVNAENGTGFIYF